MKFSLQGIATLGLLAMAAGMANAQTYSVVKRALSAKPLTLYTQPNAQSANETMTVEAFNGMGALPVLQEQGVYLQLENPQGKRFWVLGEKMEIARSLECGEPVPRSVQYTVKSEGNVIRGIGEACAKKGK